MKFTDLFVKRPVLAIVVNLVILIAGLQAIRSLSVRQYPRSDISVIQVTTVYVGANADLVRGFVTTPIERVIASADGIDYMESTSAQGLSTISVHLKINYDTTAALTQVQAKVAQVRNDLPPDAQSSSHRLNHRRHRVRGDVHRHFFRQSRSEPDHRLFDPCGAAQVELDQRRAAGRHSRAPARSRCASGSSHKKWPRAASRPPMCTMRWQKTTIFRRLAQPRARWFR